MSNHPEDRRQTADEPTMPLGMPDAPAEADTATLDPVPAGDGGHRAAGNGGHRTAGDDGHRSTGGGGARTTERTRADHDDDDRSPVDDAVDRMREPDNRAKLLMAIAAMAALTLLLTLVTMITVLSDDGLEPVIVEGVPCLVEEGPEDEAVLYCQR